MTDEKDKDKQTQDQRQAFDIPIEGSLGLLALGADGLRAWRAVRDANVTKEEEKDEEA